jgi:hypothetical protein
MKGGFGTRDFLWMGLSAAVMAVICLGAWHFYDVTKPTLQLASKADRLDRVNRMQLGIASAAEAEKSAVLAVTDEESRTFADQAREAAEEVERDRQELATLLATGGTPEEADLLARFSEAFDRLQGIHQEVLRLAVENSNVKANALLFGPAADALADMEAALSRVEARRADAPDAQRVSSLVCGARIGALRTQALLAPHIAEASDARMDRMEAQMAREDARVRQAFDDLAAIPSLGEDADRAMAASRFADFAGLKTRILRLSRENTNVRSLALSLDQERKAVAVALERLETLRKAIDDESIRGVFSGPTRAYPR